MKTRSLIVALWFTGLCVSACSGSGLDGVIDPVDGMAVNPADLEDVSVGDVGAESDLEGTVNCIEDSCDVAMCMEDTACADGVMCMAACNGAECAAECITSAEAFIQPALEQTLICATFAGCFDIIDDEGEAPICGDGVCDESEDPKTCGADCGPNIAPCLLERCGAGPACEDDVTCLAAVECVLACDDLACAVECSAAAGDVDGLAAWIACGDERGCFTPMPAEDESICGDGDCDPGEDCPDDCEVPKPAPSDCCVPNAEAGCSDSQCAAVICEEDPYCCEVEWDISCADLAVNFCPGCGDDPEPEVPVCGDGLCEGPEDCPKDCDEPQGASSCCVAGDAAGCSDFECAAGICEFMPECCEDIWSDACAEMAADRCASCLDSCGDDVCADGEEDSCPADCDPNVEEPPTGSCCEAAPSGEAGCEDLMCTELVCGDDPYCCEVEWDSSCADAAVALCEACDDDEPGPLEPPAPEGDCLASACDTGACASYDECAAALACIDQCGDSASCALACASDTSFAFQGALFGLVECGLDAGCFAEDTLPVCGDGLCEPGELDCAPDCDEPPPAVEPGDCCVASGGAGCETSACAALVCDDDPYCCQVEWDVACAEQAGLVCAVCGAGPSGPICGDGACLGGESNASCPQDCPGDVDSCGDFFCSSSENGFNCPQDCNGLDDFGACIHDECGQSLDACILYSEGCFLLVSCTQQCGEDEACNEACFADSDPVSLALFNQLRVCIGANCIDAPPSESVCGDGQCDIGELCPEDCAIGPVCGDGFCGGGETELSCPEDCAGGLNSCGDGFCSAQENGFNCPQDCDDLNPFDDCVHDECGEQLDTCILYDEGCYTLVVCLQACDGDEACSEGCYATVDALAIAIHTGLVQCVEQQCVDGPGPGPEAPEVSPAAECVIASCDVGQCAQVEPCLDALECVANCDSFECINICIEQAPPPAENTLQSAAFCGISAGCIQVEEVEGPECGDGVCEGAETTTCPEDCDDEELGVSNCCSTSELPGCNPPPGNACEEIVCAEDAFCCETAFDEVCVEIAFALCDICTSGPPGSVCGDGICEVGEDCAVDCKPQEPECGDGICEVGEDCIEDCQGPQLEGCLVDNCPIELEACVDEPACNEALPCIIDCVEAGGFECTFVCMPEPFNDTLYELGVCGGEAGCGNICGDGACGIGETYAMCPQDCPPDEGPICGDGICEVGEICQEDCAPEPSFNCGDGVCEVGEVCPEDCAPEPEPVCGDGFCEPNEDCPEDCDEPIEPGDCCSESNGQGCKDDACTETICAFDGFCCDTAWDAQCANEAIELCEVCGGSDSVCGDGACDPGESIDSCPSDCTPLPPGECCEPSGGQGCVDAPCTDAVCELDAYCCEVEWDGVCVDIALTACETCGASAVCGDGVCFEDEDCAEDCGGQSVSSCIEEGCPEQVAACNDDPSCAGALACVINCVEGGGQQCTTSCMPQPYNDTLYEVGVCGAQAGCGNVCGDGVCSATESADICPVDCEQEDFCGDGQCTDDESCSSCDIDCGDCGGDCCDGHGGLGCEDLACQQAVCQVDLDCCYEAYSDTCADIATDVCDQCAEQAPSGPVCGDGACEDGEDGLNCPVDCGGSGQDFFSCIEDVCGGQAEACFDDPACAAAFPCLEECVNNGGSQCTFSCMPEPYNDSLYQLGVCGGQSGCGNICGDGFCGPGESSAICAEDCGAGGNGEPNEDYDAEACLIQACGSDSICPDGTDCGPTLACMYSCEDEQCAAACVDDAPFLAQLFIAPLLDCASEEGCYDTDGAADTCGDGSCSPAESCATCEEDCGACQSSYDCVVENCDFTTFGFTCSEFPQCNDVLVCVSECPDASCAADCDGGIADSFGFGELMDELVSCSDANACFKE